MGKTTEQGALRSVLLTKQYSGDKNQEECDGQDM